MFALEWCEFCWAVRKLFARLGIAYKSVDIDSVALQEGDMGTKIRAVLTQRTGSPTIPQIYIGGTHVGGCIDLFDAMRAGRMRQLLEDAGVAFNRAVQIDPCLLPKWIHPRKAA
jgi:cysteine synthase A